MIVFATMGSAPLGADRMALLEVGQEHVLLSFFDYGHAYVDFPSLIINLENKFHDHLDQQRSAAQDARPR